MMNKDKSKPCRTYGFLSFLLSIILLLLQVTLFRNNLLLWNLIFVIIFVIMGIAFGLKIHELNNTLNKDYLTDLYNQKFLRKVLKKEIDNAYSRGEVLSMLIIDIDYLKVINDRHGHLVGDKMIIELAKMIKESFPSPFVPVRWGGEEFVVLMPNTSNDEAYNLAEKFRINVHQSEEFFKNSISIGLASTKSNIDMSLFFDITDRFMYKAKVNKNCTRNAGLVNESGDFVHGV